LCAPISGFADEGKQSASTIETVIVIATRTG
jgi:hypothetical protein